MAYLVAAFRPRDFGASSLAIYTEHLAEFEVGDGSEAARWIVTEGFARMPSVAELRAACGDARRIRVDAEGRALPADGAWLPEDVERAREAGVRILSEWRRRSPATAPNTSSAVIPGKRVPPAVDPAEVEAKREKARHARAAFEAAERKEA